MWVGTSGHHCQIYWFYYYYLGGVLDDCIEVGCVEFAKKSKHLCYCILKKN